MLGRVWCILRVQFRVYLKTPNVTGSVKRSAVRVRWEFSDTP